MLIPPLLFKDGIPTELDVLYVGTLPIEASPEEEEVRTGHGHIADGLQRGSACEQAAML